MQKQVLIGGVSLAILSAFSGLAGAATIPLVYENGPQKGQTYTGGPLIFQLTAFEVGTVYSNLSVGTNMGYTGLPGAAAVNSGVTTLDGLPGQLAPPNAAANGTYAGANNHLEDGWGIVSVNNIEDKSGYSLFNPLVNGLQLTGIFYGEQDFFLNQANTTLQNISGAGLQADFYLSSTQNFNPAGGTTARTGPKTYPTATAAAGTSDPTFVMHVGSLPGFIDGPGVLGGLATEFQTSFDDGIDTGRGEAFANVTSGPEASILHTQTIPSAYGFGNADIEFSYTDAPTTVGNWLVSANDPIQAYSTVPEPVSLSALGLTAAGLLGRRRRASR